MTLLQKQINIYGDILQYKKKQNKTKQNNIYKAILQKKNNKLIDIYIFHKIKIN